MPKCGKWKTQQFWLSICKNMKIKHSDNYDHSMRLFLNVSHNMTYCNMAAHCLMIAMQWVIISIVYAQWVVKWSARVGDWLSFTEESWFGWGSLFDFLLVPFPKKHWKLQRIDKGVIPTLSILRRKIAQCKSRKYFSERKSETARLPTHTIAHRWVLFVFL